MNKILKLTALALLTLVVLSPLVTAGSPTFSHKPGFGNAGGFNHNFGTFNHNFNKFSTGGVTFNTGKPFFGTPGFGTPNFQFGRKTGFQFDNDFFFHRATAPVTCGGPQYRSRRPRSLQGPPAAVVSSGGEEEPSRPSAGAAATAVPGGEERQPRFDQLDRVLVRAPRRPGTGCSPTCSVARRCCR
ncbi:MAG: hypothetical protein U0797_19185 [Gemmataceae bacterium]